MQRPTPETVTLNSILITEELLCRAPRTPNLQAENQAMRMLIHQMANDSETLLQSLVDTALELCEAGTTGVSLLETTPDGEEIFRWTVLAGTLAHHVGGSTPRNFSPCGVCLEQSSPVLFSHPERYFTYFQDANIPIVEGLVLPLIADCAERNAKGKRHVFGTIWIMSHDEQRHFDSEDVRVMTSLADFTATALLLQQRQTRELLAVNATLETEIAERKQAEEQTHALIANLPGGAAFVVDRNLRYLLAEGEALSTAGFKPDDLVGKTIFEVLPPGLAANYEPLYRRALAGEPFEHEHHAHDRTYISHGTPLRAENGEIDAVLAVSYDITERKQAEEALRESEARLALELADTKQLQFISSQLLQEETIDALYEQILDAAIALMRSDMGSMQMLHPDRNELQLLAWKGFDPASAAFWEWVRVDSDSTCGMALNMGERSIIPDLETFEFMAGSEDLNAYRDSGIRAVQSTPLISRSGRIVGMISTHWREPHQPSERELGLLNVLARQAADLIEQRQAEADLRESEEKYRSLFNSMDEGYAVVEVMTDDNGEWNDFLFLEVNSAFERQTGMVNSVGRKATEILGTPNPSWAKTYGRVAETGKPVRLEQKEETLDRIFDLYAFRLGEAGSRRVAVLFTDITDRKRRETNLAFLAELAEDFSRLSSADEIMHAVGTKVGTYLNISTCLFAEINEGQDQTIVQYPWHTPDTPDLRGVYRLSDFFTEEFRQAARSGETIVIRDTQTDPRTDGDQYAALKMHAFVSVPFHREGEWKYMLSVTDSVARDWREDEIELIREMTNRTFPRLERACAEVALRESELQRIREQSTLEQERQRAENLAELDRAKTLFFNNVSHEFRTPLTLSLAPLQDALSDRTHPLDPVQRERLELVHRNSLRLLKLVNTLLDFSRIEAGRMEAVYEPTDLATYTAELASVFRSAIERAGLHLIVDCLSLPEPVFVDREMWEKIVLNLLSNAFKFTLEGEITVSLHPTDSNQAILQIQDTGTGIAPEHLPHLFERFYQARGTQARIHEGSGIGLSLVYELVRLHGGTIEVSSTLEEGTCFTIALPFGTEHLPSDRIVSPQENHLQDDEGDRYPVRTLSSNAMGASTYIEEAERWLPADGFGLPILDFGVESPDTVSSNSNLDKPAHNPESKIQNPKSKILLVDDNADMREYLTRVLSKHAQVEAVADGVTALAVAQERVPDLVLSDVMMPGLNGFELLQALRSDPRTREVPIILLSACAGEEAIVEGLEAGADDYLIKPFSAQELISRVNAHLQMAQLRGEALQAARSMIRSRDEFVSVVSHELNTPLVSILGWTRLLRNNPPSPTMLNKALDTIERNAMLQAKLVQDLLDISRISVGKLRLNPHPLELESVIEATIATVTQTAVNKRINLTWQGSSASPVMVMGDGDRLQQVFCNLLTNAIKFTSEGGQVTVDLSLVTGHWSLADDKGRMTKDHYAEIRITDTGIGIAADFLPHIFNRFRQAEGVNSTKGLGLGLAIARHIVELHNGTIHAESAGAGQGATFIVCLPMLASMNHEQ